MNPEIAARLAGCHIQVLSDTKEHYLFARENCIALVERAADGFGSIGSTGLMTESGLAYLVWRDNRAILVGKGRETLAEPAQVEAVHRFSEDLKSVLSG